LYRKIYTCRYEQPLQAYCLIHICDALIRFDSAPLTELTDVVRTALSILKEASDGRGAYSVCGPLQEAFRKTAVSCRIPLPDDIDDLMQFDPNQQNPDAIINATTRLSYSQPIFQATRCMSPTFGEEFEHEWRRFTEREMGSRRSHESSETQTSGDTDVMKIDSILSS